MVVVILLLSVAALVLAGFVRNKRMERTNRRRDEIRQKQAQLLEQLRKRQGQ